ncbi:glycosyl hydrolase [Sesbania bispinosa]|nr:glycosyl hydrolase [Sesbania bispinosa]
MSSLTKPTINPLQEPSPSSLKHDQLTVFTLLSIVSWSLPLSSWWPYSVIRKKITTSPKLITIINPMANSQPGKGTRIVM